MESLTCKQLQKMIVFSCERIEREKEEINKINVFPVPDQDTGSNLSGTLSGIKKALQEKNFKNPKELGDAALDGALMAAQGNTGIIYTGFLVGFFSETEETSVIDFNYLKKAFKNGFERAKDSIQDPRPGTILDVMEAVSISFNESNGGDIVELFEKALIKANDALLNTPNRMEILKKAGVVDAGGLGFLMIMETYLDVLEENDKPFITKQKRKTASATKQFIQILTNRYEVVALMYDVQLSEKEMHEKLKNMGDCLDIIQVKDRVKIHIHTDDPYDVRDVIKSFGQEEAIRIEDMAREVVGEQSVFENKIGIVTDEISGLTEKIIQHYTIESIPYKIEWDGIDKLTGETVPKKLEEAKRNNFSYKPNIHSISQEFFKDAFKKQLERFDEVICITSANEYFKTFETAQKAKKSLPQKSQEKIFIIDSRSFSAGEALTILRAIDLIQEQMQAKSIAERLEEEAKSIKILGATTSPFVKSEKTSKTIQRIIAKDQYAFISASYDLNVLESLKDKQIIKKIADKAKKHLRKNEKALAVIIHGDNLKKAKEIKEELKKYNISVSFINSSDPVTSLMIGSKGILIGFKKI